MLRLLPVLAHMTHAAPAPVVEYIAPEPAGYAAFAPVVEWTAPAPVAQHLHLYCRSRGCSCHVALHC